MIGRLSCYSRVRLCGSFILFTRWLETGQTKGIAAFLIEFARCNQRLLIVLCLSGAFASVVLSVAWWFHLQSDSRNFSFQCLYPSPRVTHSGRSLWDHLQLTPDIVHLDVEGHIARAKITHFSILLNHCFGFQLLIHQPGPLQGELSVFKVRPAVTKWSVA